MFDCSGAASDVATGTIGVKRHNDEYRSQSVHASRVHRLTAGEKWRVKGNVGSYCKVPNGELPNGVCVQGSKVDTAHSCQK